MSEVNIETPRSVPKGKILVYTPAIGFSHVQYAYRIGEWLVADGFEVHVLLQKVIPNDNNNYDIPKCFAKSFIIEASGKTTPTLWTKLSAGASNFITSGFYEEINAIRADISRNFVQSLNVEEIKRENYDIAIHELLSVVAISALQEIGIKKHIYATALPVNSISTRNFGLSSPCSYLPILDEMLPCADSHVQYVYRIGEWLVADGFEVHVLLQKVVPSDNNNYDIPKCFAKSFIIEASGKTTPTLWTKLSAGASNFITSGFYEEINAIRADISRNFVRSLNVEEIKNENYDIVIHELLSVVAISALQEIGIKKHIYATALPVNSISTRNFGLSSPCSYLPILDEMLPCADDMGFWDRTRNLYTKLYHDWYVHPKHLKAENEIFLEMGLNPDVARKNARKAIDLRVYNSNILMEYPRPTTHHVVHIGGSMAKQPQALTGEIAAVFEKPSNGVILISFGTVAQSNNFPKAFRPSVLATMKALTTYEFIFRVGKIEDHPEFAELPNVTLVEWIDQVSILAHPKTRLFYTHCGLNSLNESLSFGVPLVGTPIFGDQHYNASILRKKRVGINVDLQTITPAKLVSAFKTVLENAEYAKEAQQIAQKTKNLPIQPKETFLRWVNYIQKHGAAQDFTLKSVDMSTVEVYNLDVIFTAVFVFVLALFVGCLIFVNVLNLLA